MTMPIDSAPGNPYARTRDEGDAVWFLGTLMTVKATGAETGGAFGLIEQVLPPGFAPPPHIHHNEDEAFYLLEGAATFTCGEQSWEAGPGTFVYFPRGIAHGFLITGDAPARLLQFNTPAGVERMFVEAGEPATTPTLPPPGPLEIGRVATLFSRYHLTFAAAPPEG